MSYWHALLQARKVTKEKEEIRLEFPIWEKKKYTKELLAQLKFCIFNFPSEQNYMQALFNPEGLVLP